MKPYWEQIAEIGNQVPRSELRPLLAPSNFRGCLAVGTTYAILVASFLLVHFRPSVFSVLLALVLVGGRQLALAILAHEAAHKTLFSSKAAGEWIGKWLCACPMGIDLIKYRAEHLQHHRNTGSAEDPDLGLVSPYPVSAGSMARKCLRDLLGVTGLKRVYFILLMGLGLVTYTLSTNAKPIDQTGRPFLNYVKAGLENLHGVLITNLSLFGALYLLKAPRLYLLWIGAYLTTFSLFLRIRSIAEHACTPDQENALLSTRTTHANPLARLTVAPHRVNYHLEHHLFMQVPYFNLPSLHALLRKEGILERSGTSPGYFAVMREATGNT